MLKQLNYLTLEHFLSAERLATYLRMAGNNQTKASDLYIKNLFQSSVIYTKIHWLEIGLRNAINRQLSQKYGAEWFNHPHIAWNEKDSAQLQKAKKHLIQDRKPITNSNIITRLNFGFWVNLFNPPYDTLWRHCLRRTFLSQRKPLERKQVSGSLHPILKLRNRIAHYEPILGYDLQKMQQDITDIVGWIEPSITELC